MILWITLRLSKRKKGGGGGKEAALLFLKYKQFLEKCKTVFNLLEMFHFL